MTTYSDLTASELGYLARRGSDNAWEALTRRADRGDVEAMQFLSTGNVGGEEIMMGGSCGGSCGGEEVMVGGCGGGCGCDGNCGDMMGDAASQTPSINSLMAPAQLLSNAIVTASNAASAIANSRAPVAPINPYPYRPILPPPIVRRPLPPRRIVPARPRMPAWGVFVDYQPTPMETFDTLDAANQWAQSVPDGIPVAVIHAGQEPPRMPLGYTPQLDMSSGVPQPYENLLGNQVSQQGQQQQQQAQGAYSAYSDYQAFQAAHGG